MSRSLDKARVAVSTLWRSLAPFLCLTDVEDRAESSSAPIMSAPTTPTSVKPIALARRGTFFIAADSDSEVADVPAAEPAFVDMVPELTRGTDGTGTTQHVEPAPHPFGIIGGPIPPANPWTDAPVMTENRSSRESYYPPLLRNAPPMRPTPTGAPTRHDRVVVDDDDSIVFSTRARRRMDDRRRRMDDQRRRRTTNADEEAAAAARATIDRMPSISSMLTMAATEHSVGNFPPTPTHVPPHAQAPVPIVGVEPEPDFMTLELRPYALRLPGHVEPAVVHRGLTRTVRCLNMPLLAVILNGEYHPVIEEFYRYWLQHSAEPVPFALARGEFPDDPRVRAWDQRMSPADEDLGSESGDDEVSGSEAGDALSPAEHFRRAMEFLDG